MLKIRRSRDLLIFNMGIPIPGKDGLYVEKGPRISPYLVVVSWDDVSIEEACQVGDVGSVDWDEHGWDAEVTGEQHLLGEGLKYEGTGNEIHSWVRNYIHYNVNGIVQEDVTPVL